MFGIGFTEILLISIIAILFLGPDKLPGALVEMGKFIKSIKKTVNEAKNSLEEEIKISDLKEEALSYKKQLSDATDELRGFKNLSLNDDDFDDITYDDKAKELPMKKMEKAKDPYAKAPTTKPKLEPSETLATQIEPKNEMVTLKKKSKTKKSAKKETKDKKGDI